MRIYLLLFKKNVKIEIKGAKGGSEVNIKRSDLGMINNKLYKELRANKKPLIDLPKKFLLNNFENLVLIIVRFLLKIYLSTLFPLNA